MNTIVFTPESFSLELFYIGLILNILGSIARRTVECWKLKGPHSEPDPLGRHPLLAKIAMYPLKLLGYILILGALFVQIKYEGVDRLTIWYTIFLFTLLSIPYFLKPKKGFPSSENHYMLGLRITAGRGLTFLTLFVPSCVFISHEKDLPLAEKILVYLILFEFFVFRRYEKKAWKDHGFDLESHTPEPQPYQ